jgi:glycosyltransferase involved in cell wall biosynthesis
MPVLVRRARRIVTVSAFSCAELVELAGADPARVEVIPGGVDARFRPDADPEPARAALGLTRPYVLCVASHSARKNLGALVPVAARLNLEVVVAGGHRPQFAAVAGLEGLRLLGHVDDALLPGLYAGAEAFALPSLYEGFGLPLLEAMASGTPVVATTAGALPETAGGAARLVDDPTELPDAIADVLADPEPLRAKGLERARAFSWDRTARAVDALCASAAA